MKTTENNAFNKEINMNNKTIAVHVKTILEKYPYTRDNDYSLYGIILNAYGYSSKTDFVSIAKGIYEKKIPPIESVSRIRRKVQELYPALRGEVYNKRRERTAEFIDFSRVEKI